MYPKENTFQTRKDGIACGGNAGVKCSDSFKTGSQNSSSKTNVAQANPCPKFGF